MHLKALGRLVVPLAGLVARPAVLGWQVLLDRHLDEHLLLVEVGRHLHARAAAAPDPLLSKAPHVDARHLAACPEEGLGREGVTRELARDRREKDLGDDAREAERRARLAEPAIEDMEDERRLEVDERQLGRVGRRQAAGDADWHLAAVVEPRALVGVHLEPEAVLVVAEQPAKEEGGDVEREAVDEPCVGPRLGDDVDADPLGDEGVGERVPRFVRLIDHLLGVQEIGVKDGHAGAALRDDERLVDKDKVKR
jgi:hypothetical protein